MRKVKKLPLLSVAALLVLAGCASGTAGGETGGETGGEEGGEEEVVLTADDMFEKVFNNDFDSKANVYSESQYSETGFYSYIYGAATGAGYDEVTVYNETDVKLYNNGVVTYDSYYANRTIGGLDWDTVEDLQCIDYIKDDLYYQFYGAKSTKYHANTYSNGYLAGGYLDLPGKNGESTVEELYGRVAGNNDYAAYVYDMLHGEGETFEYDENGFTYTVSALMGTGDFGEFINGAPSAPEGVTRTCKETLTFVIKGTLDGEVTYLSQEDTVLAYVGNDGTALDTPSLVSTQQVTYYDVAAENLGDYTGELPTNAESERAASFYGSYKADDESELTVKFTNGKIYASVSSTNAEGETTVTNYWTTSSTGAVTCPTWNATQNAYRLSQRVGTKTTYTDIKMDEKGNVVVKISQGSTVLSEVTYYTAENFEHRNDIEPVAPYYAKTQAEVNEILAQVKNGEGANVFPTIDFGSAETLYIDETRNDPENPSVGYDAYIYVPVANEDEATTIMNSIFSQLNGVLCWDKEEDNQYYFRDGSYYTDDSFVTCNYVQKDVNNDGKNETYLQVWVAMWYVTD